MVYRKFRNNIRSKLTPCEIIAELYTVCKYDWTRGLLFAYQST